MTTLQPIFRLLKNKKERFIFFVIISIIIWILYLIIKKMTSIE
uniref:Uncharacterized protein n=1 Tax=Spyridia filamentosa TaxID=196632 RepID=A0A1Z1MK22_SPYFI|nr:hypothetical protein [Spyridia filamentosa]ARW66286.1 hypothetical protein [Spyridia filamentosa]